MVDPFEDGPVGPGDEDVEEVVVWIPVVLLRLPLEPVDGVLDGGEGAEDGGGVDSGPIRGSSLVYLKKRLYFSLQTCIIARIIS